MPDWRLLLGLPVPYHLLSDHSHWRLRAAEFRALAATVEGDGAKEALLRTAGHYDKLAKSAEDRPGAQPPVRAREPELKPQIAPQLRPFEIVNRPPAFSLKQVPFASLQTAARFPSAAIGNPFAGIAGPSEK